MKHPEAVSALSKEYQLLLKELKEMRIFQVKNPKEWEKYIITLYNEITIEHHRINKIAEQLQEIDLSMLNNSALHSYKLESDYYKEILEISNDGRAALMEQIATYIPEKIQSENLQKEFKFLLPFYALERGIPIKKIENKKNTKIKTSYLWQSNPEQELPELHSLMINKYNLIAPGTTLEQFKAIFTGQPIDESFQPIKWLVAKNLNAYFIELLILKKKLSKAANNDIWEIAKSCFSNGSNFSQLVDSYNNNKTGKPRNHIIIDDLLNTL